MVLYIIAGPVTIGNVFGYYGHELPAGRWAIVADGEYANGGRGPSAAYDKIFTSMEKAELRLAALNSQPQEPEPERPFRRY